MGGKRWTTERIGDQSGRVAIVTGGNSGIGYETAKALAEKGATVVVASRSETRGGPAVERLKRETGGDVSLLLLDLASLSSVEAFSEQIKSRFDRLDLLINNAGVMNPPTRQETEDGFEIQMGTNHIGHFALTLRLLDLLKATAGSRVVNVSSTAQRMGGLDLDDLDWTQRDFNGWKAYGASKIANMLFTLELQKRFEAAGSPTIATAAHPGWTATNLQATTPLFRALNPIIAMRPWQGALPTLYAAVSDEAEGGGYFGPHGFLNMRGYPVPNRPEEVSLDTELAGKLWAISEEATGLRWTEGP